MKSTTWVLGVIGATLLLATAGCGSGGGGGGGGASLNRSLGFQPNVLLIYLEDANMDLGAFEHETVQTAHLDALASRGMRLQAAYCPYPVCNPSRKAVITGLRPTTTGLLANNDEALGKEVMGIPILPERFREEGYTVGGVGKIQHNGYFDPDIWHEFSDEVNDGWVEKPESPVPGDPAVIYWGPYKNGPDGSLGKMGDTKNTDKALDMLDRFEEPFFLGVGYKASHAPYLYPERFCSLYDPDRDVPALPPEEESGEWKDGVPEEAYKSGKYLDPAWDHDPEGGRREVTVAQWRCFSFVDEQIGRLFERLEALGLDQRTIVVLVSDHGMSLGYHDRFDKLALFEPSIRVPLMVSVPWMTDSFGRVSERPVETLDLYPTLLELCELVPQPGLDGRSLVPLLWDPRAPFKPAFSSILKNFGAHVQRVVRTDEYKFIYWEDGSHMLFDLVNDPGEYRNLVSDARYNDVRRDHLVLLTKHGLLVADWNNYSLGRPGTLGLPGLTVNGVPVMGSTIDLLMENSSTEPQAGIVVIGLRGAPWHLPLRVQPITTHEVSLPVGISSVKLEIPDGPEVEGVSLVAQLIQADPAGEGGLAYSRGLRLFPWPK